MQGESSNPLADFFSSFSFLSSFVLLANQLGGGGGMAPLWVTMAFIPSEEIPK